MKVVLFGGIARIDEFRDVLRDFLDVTFVARWIDGRPLTRVVIARTS